MNSKTRSTSASIAGIAAVLLLGTACGQNPGSAAPAAQPGAASGQALSIAFKTLAPPSQGDNKVEAVVKQANGKPVTDATVAVTFRMPAMPAMNMPAMQSTAALLPQGDGRYVGNGQLVMAGTWNVTVTVSRDGAEVGSSRFTVLAK